MKLHLLVCKVGNRWPQREVGVLWGAGEIKNVKHLARKRYSEVLGTLSRAMSF